MPKLLKLLLVTLLIISCTKEPEPMPTTQLIVKTATDDVRFNVEVASTPQQLQTGLMNRTTLAFNSGMIFSIYPVRPTAMWMRNTKIPLDMLFVAPDGTISMIKENTIPMSEELIISRDPVRAIVELNAGQIKRHGIKVGDKVNHSLLNNMLDTEEDPNDVAPIQAAPVQPQAAIKVPEFDVNTLANPEQIDAPAESESNNKNEPEVPGIKQPQEPTALPRPAPAAPKLPVPAPSL